MHHFLVQLAQSPTTQAFVAHVCVVNTRAQEVCEHSNEMIDREADLRIGLDARVRVRAKVGRAGTIRGY